jgi:hypothetical protein
VCLNTYLSSDLFKHICLLACLSIYEYVSSDIFKHMCVCGVFKNICVFLWVYTHLLMEDLKVSEGNRCGIQTFPDLRSSYFPEDPAPVKC